MQAKKVEEIMLPYNSGIPLSPAVTMNDKIVHAVEMMLNHNITCIAVVINKRPIGIVRLEEALQKLGLRLTEKAQKNHDFQKLKKSRSR